MLAIPVDARMIHVWASSMVLEVDAPLNRVKAFSMALSVKAASTHAGAHAGADLMVLVIDAATTHAEMI